MNEHVKVSHSEMSGDVLHVQYSLVFIVKTTLL